MNIMEAMNYRYNNPDSELDVDMYIAEKFIQKERTNDQIEDFTLWASMSKEYAKIQQLLQKKDEISLTNEAKTM